MRWSLNKQIIIWNRYDSWLTFLRIVYNIDTFYKLLSVNSRVKLALSKAPRACIVSDISNSSIGGMKWFCSALV